MIRTLFFGTPGFVSPILDSLSSMTDLKLDLIITQPDRPIGRKQIITPSPVKSWAQIHNIPIQTPQKLSPEWLSQLKSTFIDLTHQNQPDLIILAAYGKIIKPELLSWPTHGFLNIHPSLLPQDRGATPTLGPILRGDTQTAVTFMLMDELMDHGPIISQFKSPILPTENRDQLTTRLFQEAAEQLANAINSLIQNHLKLTPQNHESATFTPILKKTDGFIAWDIIKAATQGSPIDLIEFPPKLQPLIQNCYNPSQGSFFLNNLTRALATWPGMWTLLPNNKRLKILTSDLTNNCFTPVQVQLEGQKLIPWHLLKT